MAEKTIANKADSVNQKQHVFTDIVHEPELSAASCDRRLLVLGSIALVCYFATSMRLPLVPLHAAGMGMGAVEIGIINGAFYLVASIMSIPLALFSDKIGKKVIVCAGLMVFSIGSFCLCFALSLFQFVGIYILFGFGLAAFLPSMMSFVADNSPASSLGRSYGWFTTAMYVGMGVGPAMGGLLAQQFGFVPTFIVMGVIVFAIFCWAMVALPATSRLVTPGRDKKKRARLGTIFRNHRLMAGLAATLLNCFALGVFTTFLPLHAKSQELDVQQIGWIFMLQGLANAVFRIPMGTFSDRVTDRRHLVTGGGILIGFAMAGIGISTQLKSFLAASMVFGIGMAISFTAVGALIAESAPKEQRSLAMGCYNTSIFMGLMLSSVSMGGVMEQIGFPIGFCLAGAGMLLLLFIPK
jgi:MFS transporter, DHA1 family, multidrug resistance protein